MTLLEVRDLTVTVHGADVLRGVTLSLRPGEFVGLAGPNGAGKTTFLRVAAGLLRATGGTLHLAGAALESKSRKEVVRSVAYLAHGAPAHWPVSVEQVVAMGRLPHTDGRRRLTDEDWQVIRESMQQAAVEELAARPVTQLSEGERARVMIARALAQQPKLLLADEPTAALDPYHQLRVLELLRGLVARGGAVLAVFHDLPLAMRYCTRLALLAGGTILADGPPSAVVTAENVRRAYGVEMTRPGDPTAFALPGAGPQTTDSAD